MSDFRDHLNEYLKDPAFKAAWDAAEDDRKRMPDPYAPVDISPDDPRVETPEDVNGWMLWDDDDYDPDGDIYEQFATR